MTIIDETDFFQLLDKWLDLKVQYYRLKREINLVDSKLTQCRS